MRIKLGTKKFEFVNVSKLGPVSYVDEDGARILHTHSRGDARFSPLVVKLACGQTIERIYQAAKLDKQQRSIPIRMGHDTPAEWLKVGEKLYSYQEYKHEFWYLLWYIYFLENPDLLVYAKEHDGFRDVFDSRGGEVFYRNDPDVFGSYATCAQNAAQSRAIAWAAEDRTICQEFQQFVDSYWKRWH